MKKITLILIIVSSQLFAAATTWINRPQGSEVVVNGSDSSPKISRNGRYIAFRSSSANIVAGDNNVANDLFIKDTQTGETKLVSKTQAGMQISIIDYSRPTSDGNYLLFVSNETSLPMATGGWLIYMKNLITGEITAETHNNGQYPISFTGSNLFISDDARYIYFSTYTALNAIDTNNYIDIYKKDRLNNTFKLVTISTITGQVITTSAKAYLLNVSENGNFVTFVSNSNELHADANLSNNNYVGYIRDIQFNTTNIFTKNQLSETIYESSSGVSTVVSDFGVVYFCSGEEYVADDTNNDADYHKFDAGVVTRLQYANITGETTDGACPEYYRYNTMALDSSESNLLFLHSSDQLHPDATGFGFKLFSLDLATTLVSLVYPHSIYHLSASSNLNEAVFITNDRSINLELAGTTNNQGFLLDINANALTPVASATSVSVVQNKTPSWSSMSDDQNHIIYDSSANNIVANEEYDLTTDLYYYNKTLNTTDRIGYNIFVLSRSDISPNGRYVVFVSGTFHPITSIELEDNYVFLLDLNNLNYSQIAIGNEPNVNNQGDIVFSSRESTLVTNDNNNREDIFYYNNTTQGIQRINTNSSGDETNGDSKYSKIAGEGISTWVIFSSTATNLVANDVNGTSDIFMRNLFGGDVFRVTEVAGVGGTDFSYIAEISTDTTKVLFNNKSDNLVGQSTNRSQLIMYDRLTDSLSLISKRENGLPGSSSIRSYAISNTGEYISFQSFGALVSSDTNNHGDIYLYHSTTDEMQMLPRYSDYSYPKIVTVSVDDNFSTPKTGVLFQDSNENIVGLYGYSNVAGHHSLFLYQDGGDGELLTVELTGNGFVVGSLGLSCPGNCSHTYPLGYEMTLTAAVDTNQIFAGWTGECLNQPSSLDLTCEVRMDQNKTVQAHFLESNDRIFISGFEQ